MIRPARRLQASGGSGAGRALLLGLVAIAAVSVLLAGLGGRADAQGVNGYQEITGAPVTVSGFLTLSGSASCPTGDVVVSGGYTVSGGSMRITGSAPVDGKGNASNSTWTVTGFDNGDGQGSFTPYAICVSSGIAGYAQQSGVTTVAAGSSAQVTQRCGSGAVIVGGGFTATNTGLVVTESDPTSSSNVSSTTWTALVNNSSNKSSVDVTVYSVCVAASLSGYSEQLQQSSTAGTVSAQCPSGSLVIGGGGSAPAPSVDAPLVQDPTTGTFALSSTTWSLNAATTGGGVIGSIAICAAPAPVVAAVKPPSGPAAGGTSVTISGSGFTGATAVAFGSTAATAFTVNGANQITATPPAGSGAVDVTVTTPGGTSTTTANDVFRYVPSVTLVSPTSGPTTGATSVTITGRGFTGATAVTFGSTAATSFTVDGATQITATAPAEASGTIDITVTTPGGTSATGAGDRYTYTTGPTIASVSPTAGPLGGGTSVTITGTHLTGATAVKFGSTTAPSFAVNSDTQITVTAPAGAAGTVDITATTPKGTSPTGAGDRYTFAAPPAITGVSPAFGSATGGTQVTITGTDLTGATAVGFGSTAASSFSVDSSTQITATSPAGSGTVDVTVTGPGGTSATGSADRFTYTVTLPQQSTGPLPQQSTAPSLAEGTPVVGNPTTAGFSGSVNPNGLSTTAHFEYKLDPSLGGPASATSYDQQTPTQTVGSDSSAHPVSATVTGLVPNATYHVRLVATNSAGTSFGADQTFTTAKDPPPPPPVLGKTENVIPVSGLVLIKPPPGKTLHTTRAALSSLTKGKGFVPLTQARQIPDGSQIDARAGTLNVVVAKGQRRHTQQATLGGGLFSLAQNRTGVAKGLTTFNLLEGAFPGAPTYNTCTTHPAARGLAQTAAKRPSNHSILQTLHASDNNGRFRTRGRYSAGTVRGTKWDTIDRCDGTLTVVHRGTVDVLDFARRKTITVHAGHSYLAQAITTHKHKK